MEAQGNKSAAESATGEPQRPWEPAYPLVKELGRHISIQNGGLKMLFEKALALEGVCDKLRSDPAKVAIQELLYVVKVLKGSKEEVSKAFNVAAVGVKNMEAGLELKRQSPENAQDDGRKTRTEESVLAGIQAISSTLVEHSERIEAIAVKLAGVLEPPTAEITGHSALPWTTVVKKGTPQGGRKPRTDKPRLRTRPSAIVVNLGSQEDFPELTKRIKSDMDGDVVGNAITG